MAMDNLAGEIAVFLQGKDSIPPFTNKRFECDF